jgi:hypothetical protein
MLRPREGALTLCSRHMPRRRRKSSQVQALQMMKSKRDYGSYDPATAKAAASRGAPSQRPAPVAARAPAPRKTRTPADRRPRQA